MAETLGSSGDGTAGAADAEPRTAEREIGVEYRLKAGNSEWRLRIRGVDRSPFGAITLRHCAFQELWLADDRLVHRRLFVVDAIAEFLSAMTTEGSRLEYRYSPEVRLFPDHPPLRVGAGMLNGIRFQGDDWAINGGLGNCYLNKSRDPSTWIDIRDREVLQTENVGTIKLFKKKRGTLKLPDMLKALLPQVRDRTEGEVVAWIDWGTVSIMDLVRQYERGLTDGVELAVGNAEPDAHDQLIAKLFDRKAKKHHESMAEIILVYFPGEKSLEAINRYLAQQTAPATRERIEELLSRMGKQGQRS